MKTTNKSVLVCFSVVVINIITKSNLEKRGVNFNLQVQSITKGSQSRISKQNMKQDHGEAQLTGSIPLTCSAPFLIQPRHSYPDMVLATVGRPSHISQQSRACPKDMLHKPNSSDCSVEIPSSQVCLNLCLVDSN